MTEDGYMSKAAPIQLPLRQQIDKQMAHMLG